MTFKYPADVEGYSSEAECRALYDFACATPEAGTIVELGSYKGRSAIAMAQSGRTVHCVDRFMPEGGIINPLTDHASGNFSAELLRANAERYGVRLRIMDCSTEEGWRFWVTTNKPPIDLLFIDADHSYEAVKQDFQDWGQMVTADGVVVFDDSLWPGVMQLLMEIEDWAPVPGIQVGGLTAMKRISEVAHARS